MDELPNLTPADQRKLTLEIDALFASATAWSRRARQVRSSVRTAPIKEAADPGRPRFHLRSHGRSTT